MLKKSQQSKRSKFHTWHLLLTLIFQTFNWTLWDRNLHPLLIFCLIVLRTVLLHDGEFCNGNNTKWFLHLLVPLHHITNKWWNHLFHNCAIEKRENLFDLKNINLVFCKKGFAGKKIFIYSTVHNLETAPFIHALSDNQLWLPAESTDP